MAAGSHYDESAARLAAVAQLIDEALVATDSRGVVTAWNTAAERLLGYRADEIIGRPFSTIVSLPAAIPDPQHPIELTGQRSDGTTLAMSVSVAPIAGADGRPAGAIYVARDPVAQARAGRAAKHLSAIVESSDDAIVSKDLNGTIVSWNNAAEAMFGFTSDEIVGLSIRTLIPDERQAEEDEVLARIRRGERVEHFETFRKRKDATLFPVSLTVSPILDDSGRVVGASKIARDISERKRLEERLFEANRLKDEFLATLSHELRTPLNAILGYANMIKSGAVADENRQRAIDTIERNARALTKLVEDVLDVSRIVSGKMRLNVQPVNIGDVVSAAIDAVIPAADAKGVRIEMSIDPDAGVLNGDADRLQQVAWNLMSNAVKFTGRGGFVQVAVTRVASDVVILICDSGMGISPSFLPHLFERFRQADTGTRRPGGLGLGLNITKQLVELHGGVITAESAGEGKGATFRVTLPAERPIA
jgi:PAS domain S-box-containing protein